MTTWRLAVGLAASVLALSGAVLLATRGALSPEGLAASLTGHSPRATASSDASAPSATPARAASPSAQISGPTRPAKAKLSKAPSVDAAPPLQLEQTKTYNGNPVYVPAGCHDRYDVILHFHGAAPYVRELLEKAKIPAVAAVFNAGNGAGSYARAFHAAGALQALLRQVELAADPLCGGGRAQAGRVALTAWSAGYAAVEKLISRPLDRERVDAVLLADGLHAGFMHPQQRAFAPDALEAFREWGELAKRGKKLFAMTHSSIETDDYASTTECSRLLLEKLQVPSTDALVSAEQGALWIQGSPGDDRSAHIQQLRSMDATLLARLRTRWLQAK